MIKIKKGKIIEITDKYGCKGDVFIYVTLLDSSISGLHTSKYKYLNPKVKDKVEIVINPNADEDYIRKAL